MNEENTYSLAPLPTEDTYPSINKVAEVTLDGPDLEQRAFQFHYVLGDNSPGMDQLKDDINSNDTEKHKDLLVANEMSTRIATGKQLVVDNVIAGTQADPQLIAELANPGQPPNKNTIVEEQYTKKAMDAVLAATDNEGVIAAINENPMGFDKKYKSFEDTIWRNLIIEKHATEINKKVSDMGWGSWGLGQVNQLFEYGSWGNLTRNKTASVQSSAWTTPGALDEKIAMLRSLPPGEMDAALRAELNSLASFNLLDARTFIEAMQAYGQNSRDLALFGNATMIPIGTATGAGIRVTKSLLKEAKGGKAIADAVKATEALSKDKATAAATDIAKALEGTPGTTKVTVNGQTVTAAEALKPQTWKTITPDTFKDGKTLTLYRGVGNNLGEAGDTAFFSTDPAKAAKYGNVHKVEVTQEELKSFIQGHGGADEFLTDNKDIIARLAPVDLKDPVDATLEATERALSAKNTTVPQILSGTGNTKLASEISLRDNLAIRLAGDAAPDAVKKRWSDMLRRIPSMWNPSVKANLGDNFAAQRSQDLIDLQTRAQDALVASAHIRHPVRTPEAAMEEATTQAIEQFKYYHKGAEGSILDFVYVPPADNNLNVGQVKFHIGNTDGTAFATKEAAEMAIGVKGLPREFTTIKNNGSGYVLETYTDVGEDGVNPLILTPENTAPQYTWPVIRKFLSSKKQTSDFQSANRMFAVQSENALGTIIRDLYQPYEALSKRERKAFDKIMHVNQVTERIPGDPSSRGMFFFSDGELDNAYLRENKRLPTDGERSAYHAVRRAGDVDWIHRVANEYRRKATQGFKVFGITRNGPEDSLVTNKIEMREAPGGVHGGTTHNIDVIVIDEKNKVSRINMKTASQSQRDLLDKLYEDGYRTYQPYNPRDELLMKTAGTDEPTAFVITKNATMEPLRIDKQVNYRPGFHNEYKAGWYIKQPRVKYGRFEGDTTVLGFVTEAEAKKYMPRLEHGRKLLKAGKLGELNDYLKKNLPYSLERFQGLFKDHLDINVPLAVVKQGTKSTDNVRGWSNIYGEVDNDLDTLYNPSGLFGDPFVAQRDPLVHTIKNIGSESNPALELGTAPMVSPMFAQTKAMGNLIKSTLYDDYQISSANHWIETFAGDLVVDGVEVTLDNLQKNPLYYLGKATFKDGTEYGRKMQGEDLRTAIKQLLGTPSKTAIHIDTFKQKLLNGIYNNLGEKYVAYVPENMIPMLSDPLQFMRSVAFHTKLGLFNPVQFFVQGSSVINTVAISPVHGMQSLAGSLLMRGLALTEDPKIIAKHAEHAAKFPGWTKEKFIDAKRLMDSLGFDRVGGEHSWKSTMGDPTLYRGKTGKVFLDKGPFFFNAGERAVKLTAWNTAYLEFAAKNPGKIGKWSEYDVQQLGKRAQALAFNMTRDANSFWQQGLAGNFTQFWSYNVRVAELMIGKELTKYERARLAFSQGMLWGAAPVSATMYAIDNEDAGALNPFGEDLAVYAYNNGHNLDEGLTGAIHRGMVSATFGMMTGEDLDFGSRYGLNSIKVFDTIQKNFRENDPIRATIVSALGPSGSIVNDIVKESSFIGRDLYDLALGEGIGAELLPMDIANALREVSTVNTAIKFKAAMTGGLYYSQNGNMISAGEDHVAEVMKAAFGVQSVDESFAYNLMESMQDEKKDADALKQYAKRLQAEMVTAYREGGTEAGQAKLKTLLAFLATTGMSDGEKMNLAYPAEAIDITEKILRDSIDKDNSPRKLLRERALEDRNAD